MLVSSHLLAEVEQTCSHVVVMHQGVVVASGTVDDIIAGGGAASFTVDAMFLSSRSGSMERTAETCEGW